MGINDCITALREVFVCFRSALSCQKSTVQGQQNSSKRITTYCRNILIKPKSSASESIADIKRYSWAWMSDRCTSFSQQEWVLCHAKTTHLSINTLYPHMGQSDIRSMMWYMYFGKNKFIVICRCMQYTISRTKIHVCNNRTLKTDIERVWSWRLTWL